ncbi:electron transport complex subunit RsxC [Permianibacter sp. IMCC34836]|uniref:electron transport complex subunit RsxC n=1 Tax=Permianibacter fluminis TaxID=2738515 RepID=UPI001556D1C1|nr:electron transport complex subunit RsxC [Permianibacter fluminis]NQD37219.1 electron transport complex subunit RsxC [Permianibacter fluminis]
MSRQLFGFPGGIVLDDHKDRAAENPIEWLPLPPLLVLPLKQHAGLPAIPVVTEGQRVHYGQLLAKPAAGRSAGVHAPADGEISFIGLHPVPDDSNQYQPCIGICTDETGAHEEEELVDDVCLSDDDLRERIAQAGIVGLGGAGFPSAQKLTETPVKWLIINGAECEPYISCDDRLMQERAPAIIEGVQILARLLKPELVLFAIEDNKPAAITAVAEACHETNIELVVIPTKYPSGAQKQLIQNLLGFEIPRGKHSVDLGVVMYNTGTCYAIARAIAHSEPLLRRIVTVTGDAVDRPGNYDVAIGTPIEYVLQSAGLNPNKLRRVIMGGPIMGIALNELSAPVSKLTNCLIAAGPDELDETLAPRPCIRCGDCMEVCPASLLPQQLFWHIESEQHEKAAALDLAVCIECGACAYVCPSQIPLVQYYRHGKAVLRQQQQERLAAQQAKARFDAREQRLQQKQQQRAQRKLAAAPALTEPEPVTVAAVVVTKNDAEIDASKPVIAQHNDRLADVLAAAQRAKAKKQQTDATPPESSS